MATKLKKFLLASFLTASAVLAGCGSSNNETEGEDEQQTEVTAQPKSEQQIRQEQRTMYYQFVRDSVREANGAKAIEQQLRENRREYADKNDIYDLESRYSLGGVMDHEVVTAGTRILDNMYKQISAEFAKYNINASDRITQDSAVFHIRENDTYYRGFGLEPGMKETVRDYGKFDMCFLGVGESTEDRDYYAWQSSCGWDALMVACDTLINTSKYGDVQRQNMRTTINNIVEQSKKDIIASRKSVEKKYFDYYSFSNDYKDDYLALSYWGDGAYGFGYSDLNNTEKYLNTRRSVDVYDSKLVAEFFGDEDAEYTLVSLGNHKWQVVKKSKNGVVSKTHVFEDNKDFHIDEWRSNEPDTVGRKDFWFEPGVNMGVRVYFTEVINVQKRKKEWKPVIPQKVQQTIDSLKKEVENKEALYDLQMKKYHEADSIAEALATKNFGERERY